MVVSAGNIVQDHAPKMAMVITLMKARPICQYVLENVEHGRLVDLFIRF